MAKVAYDLKPNQRQKLVKVLNSRLADLIDLYYQSKQAHWNVQGPQFVGLHQLFDEIASTIHPYVDEVAERARALGGLAQGTVAVAARQSSLPNYPVDLTDGEKHVKYLMAAVGHCAKKYRGAIAEAESVDCQVTADLFTEITATLDKYHWMLSAHF